MSYNSVNFKIVFEKKKRNNFQNVVKTDFKVKYQQSLLCNLLSKKIFTVVLFATRKFEFSYFSHLFKKKRFSLSLFLF